MHKVNLESSPNQIFKIFDHAQFAWQQRVVFWDFFGKFIVMTYDDLAKLCNVVQLRFL